MEKHKLITEKTGRYFVLGKIDPNVRRVIFACHGYAQLADLFLKKFRDIISVGVIVVAPEGLSRFYPRSTNGTIAASWMTKEDREDDIRDYLIFLDKVYRDFMPRVPKKVKVTVLGFSQGAATASRWVTDGRSHVDELILWCGFFPPDGNFAKLPENITLKIVTASEDSFVSNDEREKQLDHHRENVPLLEHIHFEGGHEMNAGVLRKLFGGE